MCYQKAITLLKELNQQHLLDYYDELSEEDKRTLLEEILTTDFSVVENIKPANAQDAGNAVIAPAENAVSVETCRRRKKVCGAVGLKLLSEGKVAAVLLAGGQGSRLGVKGPKGAFDIGVTKHISIFELQMQNVKSVAAQCGRYFPLFVMTSRENNDSTVDFFKKHKYFGYPADKIYFYIQEVAPACDYNGKVFLAEKGRIALTPNGNGGWYSSLIKNGLGKVLDSEGVEWLNIYSVDNVLQKICDPVFIGATVMTRSNSGSKVVKKAYPEEKVGVLCQKDGKPAVIEYYELPDKLKTERDKDGLVYCYGVTLNYLFNVKSLNATASDKLPYHLADKAIAHVENGKVVTPEKPCGYKFETLVVDMISAMGSCLAYEVEREREFAPVKNATGKDSVETARELLKLNGIEI